MFITCIDSHMKQGHDTIYDRQHDRVYDTPKEKDVIHDKSSFEKSHIDKENDSAPVCVVDEASLSIEGCKKCPLYKEFGLANYVSGEGDGSIMIIGQNPGRASTRPGATEGQR
jgi:hypothetical protein